ncbi:transglycosylase family protein [Streptomyces sp. NPDC050504]|uniref:transglycosylase family protein n=1 Tax=Streptomyces sp. NPDC050504 TaxID=3365618 RepID=UPI003796A487
MPSHRKSSVRRTTPLAVSLALGTLGAYAAAAAVAAPPAAAATASTWDAVAQCEASGDWSADTGNGYYGGLQFTASTWQEFGGGQYAERADRASKEQQIAIAEKVLAGQGPGAWPVCSGQAGLSREDADEGDEGDEDGAAASERVARVTAQSQRQGAEKPAKQSPLDAPHSVTVRSGDTLSGLAARLGIPLSDLVETNSAANPDLIFPGQRLYYGTAVPDATSDTASGTAEPGAAESRAADADAAGSSAPSRAADRADSAWTSPVDGGTVTTPYRQPGSWAAGYHTGIDFAVPEGTTVKAAGPGTVVSAGWEGAYGNAVVVRMEDGYFTLYAHLGSVSVSAGQDVSGGLRLGLAGSTGNSTGPHLHFEARTSNDYGAHTDPAAYLAAHGVTA